MHIKGLIDEDFLNYKKPSMYICTNTCDFKCDRENGESCCQNSSLAKQETVTVDDDEIIRRYLRNSITKAIVFGGLEPFGQFTELFAFVRKLRKRGCFDDIVIYTGYEEDEVRARVSVLSQYGPIVVKYGRYRPLCESHYDDTLGVFLASPNQYAIYYEGSKSDV